MLCGPSGPRNAKIAIVGEAPGKEEEKQGIPFVGQSGKLLNSLLSKAGIQREMCYVTNVMKVRPPSNRFDQFYQQKGIPSPMLSLSIERLKQELSNLNPNIILCLGNEALKAVTGKDGIGKWRGTVQWVEGLGKVLASYHPAAVLRNHTFHPVLLLDVKKLAEESMSGDYFPPDYNLLIRPSYELVQDTISFLKRERKPISFDIETTSRRETCSIRCLGIGWSKMDAISIPFTQSLPIVRAGQSTLLIPPSGGPSFGHYWNEAEEFGVLQELYGLASDKEVPKIAQNYPFDSTKCEREWGIPWEGLWMDTLLAMHACYCELPKSLDFLVSIFTNNPRYSDHDVTDDVSEWRYNAKDACNTWAVAMRLEKEMKEFGVWDLYREIIQPAMIAATLAANRGIPIDLKEQKRQVDRLQGEWETNLSQLHKVVGFELNPNSHPQVKELLYEKWGLPIVYKKERGRLTDKPTSDEKALVSLRNKFPKYAETINLIINSRKTRKLKTWAATPTEPDGTWITTFNVAGTESGRWSSSSDIYDRGVNAQNMPRKPPGDQLRRMVCAPEGWYLIKSDFSQAEFRFVVWDAAIDYIIQRYMDDPTFDIHLWNASENVYHRAKETIKKEERNIAKAGVHGGNYGLGAQTASEMYEISYLQAKDSILGYHSGIPEIKNKWWIGIQNQLHATRTLRTPFGRQHIFFGRLDDSTYRQGYSFKPQSTVGDIINRGFIILNKDLPSSEAFPLLNVHDEIVCLVKGKERVKGVAEEIKKAMTCPIKFPDVKQPLIIPVEQKVGKNWCDMKSIGEFLES